MITGTGDMKSYDTGAIREVDKGRGRCDLMPLLEVSEITGISELGFLELYQNTGVIRYLHEAINSFITRTYSSTITAMLDVSIHYQEGAEKYGVRNWEKGLPMSRYLSSAARHLMKHDDGRTDESHDRAFLWNILALLHMERNSSMYGDLLDLYDLPYHARKRMEV